MESPDPLVLRGSFDVLDLTRPVGPATPLWPGTGPVEVVPGSTIEADGSYANTLRMPEHTGTHVDAPAHYAPAGPTVDRIPARDLVCPVVAIDVSDAVEDDPDYACPVEAIARFEAAHGRVPEGSVVCLHTGWGPRWKDAETCRNADEDGVLHFPGFSGEAARHLVEKRGIRGVGIDTLSVDPGASEEMPAHEALSAAGCFNLEGLAFLERLPPVGATLVVGVLPVLRGSGGPARVLALVPRRGPTAAGEEAP